MSGEKVIFLTMGAALIIGIIGITIQEIVRVSNEPHRVSACVSQPSMQYVNNNCIPVVDD